MNGAVRSRGMIVNMLVRLVSGCIVSMIDTLGDEWIFDLPLFNRYDDLALCFHLVRVKKSRWPVHLHSLRLLAPWPQTHPHFSTLLDDLQRQPDD